MQRTECQLCRQNTLFSLKITEVFNLARNNCVLTVPKLIYCFIDQHDNLILYCVDEVFGNNCLTVTSVKKLALSLMMIDHPMIETLIWRPTIAKSCRIEATLSELRVELAKMTQDESECVKSGPRTVIT